MNLRNTACVSGSSVIFGMNYLMSLISMPRLNDITSVPTTVEHNGKRYAWPKHIRDKILRANGIAPETMRNWVVSFVSDFQLAYHLRHHVANPSETQIRIVDALKYGALTSFGARGKQKKYTLPSKNEQQKLIEVLTDFFIALQIGEINEKDLFAST